MQNALTINEKFGQFTLGTRQIPTAGPGELLVKVRAVALNPIDWKNQKWGFLIDEYPAVLGWDISGDVVAVGEGVTRFSIGDKVFGQGLPYPDYGGFQEYSKLKEDFAAKVPANTTYEEASTFPVALSAAFIIMSNQLPHGMDLAPLLPSGQNKYAKQPILIIGGASSVGQFVIQLAKAYGFSPIITTASIKHTKNLKGLGATHIIDRTIPLNTIQPRIAEIIAETSEGGVGGGANNGLINRIYDAISGEETQTAAYDLLAPGGTLALVLPAVVPTDSGDKSVVTAAAMPNMPESVSEAKVLYSLATSLIENEIVKPSNVEVVPGGLAAIVDGLGRLERNQVSGEKLVVRPSEGQK